jgi:hypothetical protein
MRNNIRNVLLIATAIICLASASAMARTGLGLRFGLSNGEAGQYHIGVHYISPSIISHFLLRPAIAMSRGEDLQLITYNFDVAYRFLEGGTSQWSVYVGGGPGLVNAKGKWFDNLGGSVGGQFSSNTRSANLDPGYNWGYSMVTGVEHAGGFMVEIRKGMYACPAQMFTLGYSF